MLWPSLLPNLASGQKTPPAVDACPVDCIHPKKNTTYDDAPLGFDEVPQVFIDPIECIDCGLRDFRAGQPTRKVEALHRNEREFVHGGKSTRGEYAKHKAAE